MCQIIFPYRKENILGRKRYVLNLVCFGSGTATFDKRGTIESETEERCLSIGYDCWKAALSRALVISSRLVLYAPLVRFVNEYCVGSDR